MSEPTQTRETDGLTLPLRVADLPNAAEVAFRLSPTPEARADLARQLDLRKLRKLDFAGRLMPEGRHDWKLLGRLGATAVQDCVITGDPVTTRVDTDVERVFVRRMPEPEGEEVEIPDDDRLEQMGTHIDPGAVMAEALSLALPDYPRAPGASLDTVAEVAPEGAEPLRRNPFEALKALRTDAEDAPTDTGGDTEGQDKPKGGT